MTAPLEIKPPLTCATCGSEIGILRGSAGFRRLCARCLLAGAASEWTEAAADDLHDTGGAAPPSDGALAAACGRDGALTGRTLGSYDLLDLLGSGSMGTVYRARQRGLDRLVALKVLAIPGGTDALERFLREARAMARLQHPNIVGVHEIGSDGGHHFYAMDLVGGETLEGEVRRRGPLPARRAAVLLSAIARAVQHAHEHGIVHRDLKPANILLGPEGTPLVADFGLARDMSQAVRMTRQDATLGTVPYMAPEQAAGRRDEVDWRTDVYALGAILYECLTGQPPFRGESVFEVLRKVQEEAPRPPRERRPEADAALEAICLRAMAKRPADRFPSALALAEEVERVLDGSAPTFAAALPPRPAARRTRRRALVTAALILIAAGAALLEPWAHSPSPPKGPDESGPPLAGGPVSGVPPTPAPAPAPPPPEPPPAPAPEAVARMLEPGIGEIYSIAYDPTGKRLAVGGLKGRIVLYDAETLREEGALEGHPNAVYCLAFSRDGRTLVSGGWEKALKLWDVDRKAERRALPEPSAGVWSVALSPDGKRLVSGSHDGSMRVWDLARGERIRTIRTEYRLVTAIDVSPDGATIAAAGPGPAAVGLWRLEDGAWIGMARGLGGEANAVRFAPGGRVLAASSDSGEVKLWEAGSWNELATLRGNQGPADGVAFRADGAVLASGGHDGSIALWDLGDLANPRRGFRRAHRRTVKAIAFRPDGKALASGSDDGSVRVETLREGGLGLEPVAQAGGPPLGGWRISIGIEDDAPRATLERWAERVEAASALLHRLTEGQFHIAQCSIEDRTSRGRIVIPSGALNLDVLPGTEAMARSLGRYPPLLRIESVGDPDGRPGHKWELGTVLLHEMLHGAFGLPDERDGVPGARGRECGSCIMGSDPGLLCGPETHRGSIPRSCKEAIAAAYSGSVRFPNPSYVPGAAPPRTIISAIDHGPRDIPVELQPWSKEEEKVVRALEAKGRALAVKVAFEGDASPTQIRRWMRNVLAIDDIVRKLTDDQIFIARCTIADRTKNGLIVIEKGSEDRSTLLSAADTMWSPRGASWLTAGDVPPEALARYVLPALLKLGGADDPCGSCFLDLSVWDARTRLSLCDERSHRGEGRPCRERFFDSWRAAGVIEPEKRRDFRSPPGVRFTIEDG